MNKEKLQEEILKNLKSVSSEVKRVFHGRGNFYEDFNYLTIDSLDNLLLISLYEQLEENIFTDILEVISEVLKVKSYEIVLIQHRYKKDNIYEALKGKIPQKFVAIEDGLKYQLNFKNQNIGLFFDMKNGRKYIKSISKDKNILNLFSYTCAFSVSCLSGEAKKVINVDMSKSALSIGRENHHLNSLDTTKVQFMPYNILKSFSRIKKYALYDIIIIDPPSFQRGSFEVSRDYEKIIRRLESLSSDDCIVVACLNAPNLRSEFIIDIFEKFAPSFKYKKRVKNPDEFVTNDEQRALKTLVFEKTI